MKLGFNIQNLEQKFSKNALSHLVSVGFLCLLLSKFYYLWGTSNGLAPDAPWSLILVRDLIVFAFLIFFGFLAKKRISGLIFFWVMIIFGLGISFLHLVTEKDLATWGQHYFRNTLVPLMFYPVIYGILKFGIQASLRSVMIGFYCLNLSLSYWQLFAGHFLVRPTGFFGDPILNTLILFWGLSAILLSGNRKASLVAAALLMPLLQYASSLSAILSFCLASMTIGLFTCRQWFRYAVKHLRWILFSSVLIALVFFAVYWKMDINPDKRLEGLTSKIQYFHQALTCQDNTCWRHWSLQGRIESNLRPIQMCRENLYFCFFGDLESSHYGRMESTFGSLIVNWGAGFFGLYLVWILFHLRISFCLKYDMAEKGKDRLLWGLIFYSGFFFALFNTLMYRFPLNLFFYSSMAYIFYQVKRDTAPAVEQI